METFILLSRNACAVIEHGHWRPGIGDPTFLGWVTTISYFLAVLLCSVAARHAFQGGQPGARNHAVFWGGLALLFLLLGINKQLDLQTWLWLTGRHLAREEGWYAQRQWIEVIFISLVALGGVMILTLFYWLSPNVGLHRWLALGGAVFVTCFVLIRAASFHHIDTLLGMRFGALNLNVLLELPGILCVIVSALCTLFSKRPSEIST